MYSLDEFKAEWQRRHWPTMNLDGDVGFYYSVYRRMYSIAVKSAKFMRDDVVISLAMYVENTASIGLDKEYERMYRSIGDLVMHWCRIMEMSADGYARMKEYASEAVYASPADGSLKRWIIEKLLSGDFNSMKEVAVFFAKQDLTVNMVYPMLDFRVGTYKGLANGDEKTAWQMLWSDMAFNWYDKTGTTILRRLAGLLGKTDEERKAADNLLSVNSMRLEAYLPKEGKGGNALTLLNKEGRELSNVVFSTPIPKNYGNMCFIGQLASYLGKTYVNGPGVWYDRDVFDRWDGGLLWQEIESKEKEYAKETFFTTPFGEKGVLYDDLYKTSEDSTDTYHAVNGLYLKEPNILNYSDSFPQKRSIYAGLRRNHDRLDGRKIPKYSYKPRGKQPAKYFQKKVCEVRKWKVDDVNDINYGLRVYEGWCQQAQAYLDSKDYNNAIFIARTLFWEASYYATAYVSYELQLPRLKKIIRNSHNVVMASLLHDPANWREAVLHDYKIILADKQNILNSKKWVDLEKSVSEVEKMMKTIPN